MIKTLFNALTNSRSNFLQIFNFISKDKISSEEIDLIEEMLIETDIGYDITSNIIDIIQEGAATGLDLKNNIKSHLLNVLEGHFELNIKDEKTVLLVIGVNGSGKTTTAAKLANFYNGMGRKVTLVAADTYRAAAVEQLRIWSKRVGCKLICNENTSEPASVVFNGLESANAMENNLVIIDTAGRLHTSKNLMKELEKINTVIEKRFPEFSKFSLITIDATLGQNSLVQAREFSRYCNIDGAVLTKLDGSAKGGIVFPLYSELKIPVNFVGIGESFHDLEVFCPFKYLDSMLDKM